MLKVITSIGPYCMSDETEVLLDLNMVSSMIKKEYVQPTGARTELTMSNGNIYHVKEPAYDTLLKKVVDSKWMYQLDVSA